jgi:DNA-binding CsgD family transcriptional regulator
MAGERHAATLIDRIDERFAIDRLVRLVRAGHSQVLVLHGEAGVGKTMLLRYLRDQATGCRVLRAFGVQSEMELAFAGLHQLCAPLLDRLADVPGPQRDALLTAFGMSAGPPPDRFLVGLAALSLLSAAAEDQPVIAIIDDAQWLDRASAQALGFVARRLSADAVGLVAAARVPGEEASGLPQMTIGGLKESDARTLLDSVLSAPIDDQIRDRLIAEARGNPLALVELPRGLTAAEMAGGYGLPAAASALSRRIEDSFRRQIEALPDETQRLLVLAAADPSGDLTLVWRAAAGLGIAPDAAEPAADAGLADFGARLRFRHPLVRSATYRSASPRARRQAHAALAEATDPEFDPDRRAWHRAQAASGPDEDVAAELEHSAGRARSRGGLAAAAAFLERAAMLTLDPARRAERALEAAGIKLQAGAYDAAKELLATAEAGPLSKLQHAQCDILRARLAYLTNRGSDAPPLLLDVARRLEGIDVDLSRATYLDAMVAAMFAGRLAAPGSSTRDVAQAAIAAPRPLHAPRAVDLLLDGLAVLFSEGYGPAVPTLRRALDAFDGSMSTDEELSLLFLGSVVAQDLWDDQRCQDFSLRLVQLSRQAGSLSELPIALSARAYMMVHAGDLAGAASVTGEAEAAAEATRVKLAPYGAMALAAMRGRQAETSELIEAATRDVVPRGEGTALALIEWSKAVLYNGLGRYPQAIAAAEDILAYQEGRDMGSANYALVELAEAAVHTGQTDKAAGAVTRFTEVATATGTEWALGTSARCRALLCEGDEADGLFRESITRLGRARARPDLARAHLLYGEWLRREHRRAEARNHLHIAHDMLEAMGMEAFAERAAHELQATGETARRRAAGSRDEELTAQEAQIARLARVGLSNPEIGARLFISARTVQYHLSKIFAKLDITSRSQLHEVLVDDSTESLA